MTSFKSWLSILFLLPVVACVKANRHHTQQGDLSEEVSQFGVERSLISFNNRALFEAGNIELEDIQFSRGNQNDSFLQVDQVRLWLKVCHIRDRAAQGTLRNEKFIISSEIGDSVYMTRASESSDGEDNSEKKLIVTEISNPIQVNQGNCLRWSQMIPAFNFMAPSLNITLHYEIESLSGNLGRIIRRVGFNPWDMHRNKSKTKGFRDLTDHGKQDWGEGQWVSGENNVLAALKGELFESDAQLSMRGLSVVPLERESAEYRGHSDEARRRMKQEQELVNQRMERLSPQERRRYQNMRKEINEKMQNERGLQITVNMSGQPFVRVPDSTGVPHDIDLETGRFRVHMNLVAARATEGKDRFLLSSNVSQITGRGSAFTWEVDQNGLLASVPLVMRDRCENCRMELAVKISPVSQGLRNVKPFTAVYDLGEYDSWMRRQAPEFRFDENYKPLNMVEYDTFINGLEGVDANITTLRPQERFFLGPFRIRFVRIMPGETATDRTLQYSVESCIEHGLYGNRVGRGLQFEVTTEDEGVEHKIVRQTNEAGCLTWFGFLSHKYYRKEVLQEKYAKVRYIGSRTQRNENGEVEAVDESGGMVNPFERTYTYYMNPWDEKFTFGWDEPDMPEGYDKEVIEQRENAPVSTLFIPDFRYQTMGFRYEIDNYLRLKVKKAVLLQVNPWVLKYNSIVEGRRRTEPLRDGIYLMKVALHKYYLDPAARGVRIYDEDLSDPLHFAEEDPEKPLMVAEALERMRENGEDPRAFDLYDLYNGPTYGNGQGSQPKMTYAPGIGDRGVDIDHRLLDDDELEESKKEFISHQTKLVRVLGGRIITPIEFDIDDLRLMRIRNQFVIQLETIDERRLREATFIDGTLQDMNVQGDIEGNLQAVFEKMQDIENIENERIQRTLDIYDRQRNQQAYLESLTRLDMDRERAEQALHNLLGLDHFEPGSEAYERHLELIRSRLAKLQEYRLRVQDTNDGLNYQNAFRNQKRQFINTVMRNLRQDNSRDLDDYVNKLDRENRQALESDPFLKYFFMDIHQPAQDIMQSFVDYRARQAEERNDPSFAQDLRTLQLADFSEAPLTPSFNFEMLRNDGDHDPDLPEDDGKSGLPSRTFIGPLTFVFNTNASALRPTDILNERVCPTAFCETPDRLIQMGVPPAPVERSYGLNSDGSFMDFGTEPIYTMAESVNSDYENNKYYGYLKAYADVTVDDLIDRESQIRELDFRRTEQGAQIINFVKSYNLKYTLLADNPASRLKSINHQCAENIDISRLEECFSDIFRGPDIMQRDSLFDQMNNRQAVRPQFRGDNFGWHLHHRYYDLAGEEEITPDDLRLIMEKGWKDESIDPDLPRRLMHRMCFVLAQNFFSDSYFKKSSERSGSLQDRFMGPDVGNYRSLSDLEIRCHRDVGRIYGYGSYGRGYDEQAIKRGRRRGLKPQEVRYLPIVLERKLRVYNTTDRYVYRGGKSLNLNLTANFNLQSQRGVRESTTGTFKPWDSVTGIPRSLPVIGGLVSGLLNSFGLSRQASRDEAAQMSEGTQVNSGTFLVSQQSTFDIELGEYERCLVMRFHPAFLRDFLSEDNKAIKEGFDADEDVAMQGVLVCSGRPERKCMPIKEKYFYLTQHFTEGDMLDVADLHNHPWLLQLRGLRDFQVFTSMAGAREMKYIDNNDWLTDVGSRILSDAASMNFIGSRVGNAKPKFEVVSQESDINWPLEELSRAYFEVLPTFPSLYTYFDETSQHVSEWPYQNTDPGQSFQRCEP